MKLFKKKRDVVKEIYSKDRVKRYVNFFVGLLLLSISFNIFLLQNDIVSGVSGLGIIFNKVWHIDPSLVIMIGSLLLLILSYIFLGKEQTVNSVLGSILYPVFVKLTAWIIPFVDIGNIEPFLIAIIGAIMSGTGLGLLFKSGFTTGGSDILNQILSKYFKLSMGNAMFFTDGFVIGIGLLCFGFEKTIYSVVYIYILSIVIDKVMLGISNSKAFYIITNYDKEVKKYILENLVHGVTVIDAHGGYTGNKKKMIMCIVPTKEYFKLKEGIYSIDPKAFFLVTDAYEVSDNNLNV